MTSLLYIPTGLLFIAFFIFVPALIPYGLHILVWWAMGRSTQKPTLGNNYAPLYWMASFVVALILYISYTIGDVIIQSMH